MVKERIKNTLQRVDKWHIRNIKRYITITDEQAWLTFMLGWFVGCGLLVISPPFGLGYMSAWLMFEVLMLNERKNKKRMVTQ